jgi:hypothetical protein
LRRSIRASVALIADSLRRRHQEEARSQQAGCRFAQPPGTHHSVQQSSSRPPPNPASWAELLLALPDGTGTRASRNAYATP